MNRREILTVISTSALLGTGGCLETDTSFAGGNENGPRVLECTRTDAWSDGSNGIPENPGPASIAARHDCSNTQRPEPTGDVCTTFTTEISGEQFTFHSAGIKSYPDPPASFDEETLVSYVYEYEKAYFQNSMVNKYRDELTGVGLGVEEDETQVEHIESDMTVIYIWFFTSTSVLHDGAHPVAGDGAGAASYAIDETGIVRAEAKYNVTDEEMPDPVEDGALLECF